MIKAWAVLTLLTVAGAANAADSTSTVSMPAPKAQNDITKRLYADFAAYYRGPTLDNMGSPNGVSDGTGRSSPTGTAGLDSEISAAYLLNTEKMVGVGVAVPFIAQPLTGREFIMGDAGIRFFDKMHIDRGGFRLNSNYTVQFPTSQKSQDRNMDYAVKYTPYVRYKFTNGLTVGAWLEAKYYANVDSGQDYRLYVDPHVRYDINDRWALNVEYELDYQHYPNRPAIEFHRTMSWLRPMMIVKFGKFTEVAPYVQMFPPDVAMDTSSIGMVLVTRML